jgi:putative ABC transport system permease protein
MQPQLLKLTFRSFSKNKTYVLFNIFGLTTALATFILISLYVRYETSWDTFNDKHERIYRLEPEVNLAKKGEMQYFTQTPWPAGKALKENYSEVQSYACLRETWGEYLSASSDQEPVYEENGYYTTNQVFDVFTFNFMAGNPNEALSEPNTVVLTQSLAQKYFPGENPMGQTLIADNKHIYRVTGIIEDPPSNFHLKPAYFVSVASFKDQKGWDITSRWESYSSRVYVLLNKNIDKDAFAQKIRGFINSYNEDARSTLHMKELSRVHLQPSRQGSIMVILYLFAFSGLLILFLGGINFTNLMIAYMSTRTREVGIKKVMGGHRTRMIREMVTESFILTIGALLLAFTVVELVLPIFSQIVARDLDIRYVEQWPFIMMLIGISLLMGFLAALQPAIKYSRYSPIEVLSGKRQNSAKPSRQRMSKVLTTFQLFISMAFVLFALSTHKQVQYLIDKDMGFKKENLLLASVDGTDDIRINNWTALRNELLMVPGVENASVSYHAPYHGSDGGFINWEGSTGDQKLLFLKNDIGYHFVETYGMKLVKGRNFSPAYSSDSSACLINETAARSIGWDDPIGKTLNDGKYRIIGMLEDFHKLPPFVEVMPQIMRLHDENLEEYKIISIRIRPGIRPDARPDDFMNTFRQVQDQLKTFFPGEIIDLHTMDDSIRNNETTQIYRSLAKAFTFFAVIAIVIAIVGLFALVAFSSRQRVKEIGIRKVMGATSSKIYRSMVWSYLKYYMIAAVLAVAADQLVARTDPAAYKAGTDPLIIVSTLAGALMVILLTISTQIIRTAHTNPADSLRDE